jgi:hypothetical protein
VGGRSGIGMCLASKLEKRFVDPRRLQHYRENGSEFAACSDIGHERRERGSTNFGSAQQFTWGRDRPNCAKSSFRGRFENSSRSGRCTKFVAWPTSSPRNRVFGFGGPDLDPHTPHALAAPAAINAHSGCHERRSRRLGHMVVPPRYWFA